MSYQHPMILFVGSSEKGTQLLNAVEPLGWWVYQPETVNDTLGMYVAYLPDIIMMDAEAIPEIVDELYFHLAPVAHEPIIVIAHHERWSDRVTHHLPAEASLAEIIDCVAEITHAEREPIATPH